ncbi:MAG TPA: rhodanese-like domain-containing protein [Geobacteraceae bacterium]
MKRYLVLILLLVTASFAFAAAPRDISSAEAKALLAKNRQVFLLDVRTPEEYRQAHLKGATLIPLADLDRRVGELPKNRTLLVYCAVGSRSRIAASSLARRGYKEVYNMSDGIVGWYRNGFPLER